MVTQIWLQNKQSLTPFEVRAVGFFPDLLILLRQSLPLAGMLTGWLVHEFWESACLYLLVLELKVQAATYAGAGDPNPLLRLYPLSHFSNPRDCFLFVF